MGFEEAKELEAEMTSDGKNEKGKRRFWDCYNGQYNGTRTFG